MYIMTGLHLENLLRGGSNMQDYVATHIGKQIPMKPE